MQGFISVTQTPFLLAREEAARLAGRLHAETTFPRKVAHSAAALGFLKGLSLNSGRVSVEGGVGRSQHQTATCKETVWVREESPCLLVLKCPGCEARQCQPGGSLFHLDTLGISQKIPFLPLTPPNGGEAELLILCLSGGCPHPVPMFWDCGGR